MGSSNATSSENAIGFNISMLKHSVMMRAIANLFLNIRCKLSVARIMKILI